MMIKCCKVYTCPNGMLGLHLTRAPWDPYPWISGIQTGSSAEQAGIHAGDTVLEINSCDVLGQRIVDIAEKVRQHWRSGAKYITMVVWRNKSEDVADNADITCDKKEKFQINQQSLQKFATCLQYVSQLLECPVCLEVIRPPSWQCCNGHVLCNNCRSRSTKCPVCRVPFGTRGRCLLADKLFRLLAESFPCESGRNVCKTTTEHRKAETKSSTSKPEILGTNKNGNNLEGAKMCENIEIEGCKSKSDGKAFSQTQWLANASNSGSKNSRNNNISNNFECSRTSRIYSSVAEVKLDNCLSFLMETQMPNLAGGKKREDNLMSASSSFVAVPISSDNKHLQQA